MHSTEGLRAGPHKRPRIWRFVIVAVLVAAIGEPIVMYRALAHEKEQRRASAELSFGVPTALTGGSQAASQ